MEEENEPGEWIDMGSIRMWERNPRVNDHAVERMARSITQHGFTSSILVWKEEGRIINGHLRYKAMQQLGRPKIRAVVKSYPSEADAIAAGLDDNLMAEKARWQADGVAELLTELAEDGYDLDNIAIDGSELEALLDDLAKDDGSAGADSRESEPAKVPRPEGVTLLEGDCLGHLKTMKSESVDSLVTDPPYGLSAPPDVREVLTKWMSGEDYESSSGGFMGAEWDSFVPGPRVWEEIYRVMKPGAHGVVFAGTRTVDLMGMALRLAGFEVRDVIHWCYWCVDEQTQALTRGGWKYHHELRNGEQIAAWVDDRIEWQPAKFSRFEHDGPMVEIRGKFIDQLVTPNHRVVGEFEKRRKEPAPGVMFAGDLLEERSTVAHIPTGGVAADGDVGPGPEAAYILGWWLTDAWAHADGKACMFSQCKPATLAKLRAALEPLGASEYVKEPKSPNHNAEHTFYLTGVMADWLLDVWHEREIRPEVLSWTLKDRRALLRGLLDGDGSEREGGWTFWSQRPERRALVAALASCLGWRVQESKPGKRHGAVHGSLAPRVRVRGIHRSSVHYAGVVWCPTVDAGAWLCRRGQHVSVTGNSGFPKSLDLSKAIDDRFGAVREGTKTVAADAWTAGGRKALEDGLSSYEIPSGDPVTEQAIQWQGWGTALKPAIEPAILIRKPIAEGSTTGQVLATRTGGINIDGCRFRPGDPIWPGPNEGHSKINAGTFDGNNRVPLMSGKLEAGQSRGQEIGRFPANLIHFPKPSRSEREAGCDHLPAKKGHEAVNRKEGSAGTKNPRAGAGRTAEEVRNTHTTVKPIRLMDWLCRLLTPPNGTVLDPFMGSGTTGAAAAARGFGFVGCELLPEHFAICEARIAHWQKVGLE